MTWWEGLLPIVCRGLGVLGGRVLEGERGGGFVGGVEGRGRGRGRGKSVFVRERGVSMDGQWG